MEVFNINKLEDLLTGVLDLEEARKRPITEWIKTRSTYYTRYGYNPELKILGVTHRRFRNDMNGNPIDVTIYYENVNQYQFDYIKNSASLGARIKEVIRHRQHYEEEP